MFFWHKNKKDISKLLSWSSLCDKKSETIKVYSGTSRIFSITVHTGIAYKLHNDTYKHIHIEWLGREVEFSLWSLNQTTFNPNLVALHFTKFHIRNLVLLTSPYNLGSNLTIACYNIRPQKFGTYRDTPISHTSEVVRLWWHLPCDPD